MSSLMFLGMDLEGMTVLLGGDRFSIMTRDSVLLEVIVSSERLTLGIDGVEYAEADSQSSAGVRGGFFLSDGCFELGDKPRA
jgi:hypothetical protein